MEDAERWPQAAMAACGAVCAALGALVLLGWHTGQIGMASGFFRGGPTAYVVAASLLLCGVGLLGIAFGWRGLALPGGLLAIVASVTAPGWHASGSALSTLYSRLSASLPLAAAGQDPFAPAPGLQLAVMGAALLLLEWREGPTLRVPAIGACGAILSAMGLIAAFSALTGVGAHTLRIALGAVPPQTSLAIAVFGAGLMAAGWREGDPLRPAAPSWVPMLVGAAGITATLLLWQVFSANRPAETAGPEITAHQLGQELSTALSLRAQPLHSMAQRWERLGSPRRETWEVEAGMLVARLGGYRAVQWVDPSLQVRWSVPEVGQDATVPRGLALGATQARARAASRASPGGNSPDSRGG